VRFAQNSRPHFDADLCKYGLDLFWENVVLGAVLYIIQYSGRGYGSGSSAIYWSNRYADHYIYIY
jgi:hypothetical protein